MTNEQQIHMEDIATESVNDGNAIWITTLATFSDQQRVDLAGKVCWELEAALGISDHRGWEGSFMRPDGARPGGVYRVSLQDRKILVMNPNAQGVVEYNENMAQAVAKAVSEIGSQTSKQETEAEPEDLRR